MLKNNLFPHSAVCPLMQLLQWFGICSYFIAENLTQIVSLFPGYKVCQLNGLKFRLLSCTVYCTWSNAMVSESSYVSLKSLKDIFLLFCAAAYEFILSGTWIEFRVQNSVLCQKQLAVQRSMVIYTHMRAYKYLWSKQEIRSLHIIRAIRVLRNIVANVQCQEWMKDSQCYIDILCSTFRVHTMTLQRKYQNMSMFRVGSCEW